MTIAGHYSAYPPELSQSNPSLQSDYADDLKVAHLLLDAKLILPDQLEAALASALEYEQSLTRVIGVKYDLPDETLAAARLGQQLIDDLTLDRMAAAHALRKAHVGSIPFDYVIARTEKQSLSSDSFTDIELLLLESGLTTRSAIREARAISMERNIPIAGSLLSTKAVQYVHLNYALECIQLMSKGLLSAAKATEVMKSAHYENLDLKTALERHGFAASNTLSRIKVGDFLLQAKLVSEENMLAKVEESIVTRHLIGRLLVDSELVDEDVLIDVLILQTFCEKDLIDKHLAVKILRKSVDSQRTVASISLDYGAFRDDPETAGGARALLIRAGLTDADRIDQAEARFFSYGMDCLHALVAAGFLTSGAHRAAVECAYLTSKNLLSEDEAMFVLQNCDRSECNLQEEIAQLPRARKREIKRNMESTVTDSFLSNERSKPRLHKSIEFVWALAIITVAIFGATMVTLHKQYNLGGFGPILFTFLAGVGLVQIGIRWEQTVRRKRLENEAKEETAKGTIKRLSHSTRKFT